MSSDWFLERPSERYRPMLQILSQDEILQMRAQPGFTPRMESALRRERCEAFQRYLRALRADFSLCSLALKMVILQSQEDRPDLAIAVLRNQATFAWGLVGVRFRIFRYRWVLPAWPRRIH